MNLKELDTIITIVDISSDIKKGTKGVILYILEEDKKFLVEFINDSGETIGDGMETVYYGQIIKYNRYSPPLITNKK